MGPNPKKIAHWLTCQQKFLPDLRMRSPSAMEQIDHELPPKPWLTIWPRGSTVEKNVTCFLIKKRGGGFPGSSSSSVFINAGATGDLGSIPGWGRFSWRGNGNQLQYSCLENSMDRGAWWATVHGVPNSQTTEQLQVNDQVISHCRCPQWKNKQTNKKNRILGLDS